MSDKSISGTESPFFVYILQCSDSSYYVGRTYNLDARVALHNAGKAARWTSCRRPVLLVYSEPAVEEGSAMAREAQLKRWSASKKRALISGNLQNLKHLSRCRTQRGNPKSSVDSIGDEHT